MTSRPWAFRSRAFCVTVMMAEASREKALRDASLRTERPRRAERLRRNPGSTKHAHALEAGYGASVRPLLARRYPAKPSPANPSSIPPQPALCSAVTFPRWSAARCGDFSEPRLLADARHRLRLWA